MRIWAIHIKRPQFASSVPAIVTRTPGSVREAAMTAAIKSTPPNNVGTRVIPLRPVPCPLILPDNALTTAVILPNASKTSRAPVKKRVSAKRTARPEQWLRQLVLMMPITKNANAIPATDTTIPMNRRRLRVILLTEAVRAVRKQNTSVRKTPAPVIRSANAAVKSALQPVTQAQQKNSPGAKAVIPVPVIMIAAEAGNIAPATPVLPMRQNAVFTAPATISRINATMLQTATEFTGTGTVRANVIRPLIANIPKFLSDRHAAFMKIIRLSAVIDLVIHWYLENMRR